MGLVPTSSKGSQNPSYADQLALALGVQFQTANPAVLAATTAWTTQQIRGTALYATAGALLTGIKMRCGVAAAGTTPTTARLGLADSAGKILVVTANVNAAASWPAGVATFPFTAPYTLLASGAYFPCLCINGVWGTTQPTPLNAQGPAGTALVADGANPPVSFLMTAQADLPAVGASLVLTASSNLCYWFGLY